MKFNPRYCSHYPVLVRLLLETNGPVLEAGMGAFSSPVMHWLCFDQGRDLVSLDSNEEYVNLNRRFASKNHEVQLIDSWDDYNFDREWDVVFVDNEKDMRAPIIRKVSDKANYIIVHDSEEQEYYHYNEVFPLFQFRYDYTKALPYTSVLSNKRDLSWLKTAFA